MAFLLPYDIRRASYGTVALDVEDDWSHADVRRVSSAPFFVPCGQIHAKPCVDEAANRFQSDALVRTRHQRDPSAAFNVFCPTTMLARRQPLSVAQSVPPCQR